MRTFRSSSSLKGSPFPGAAACPTAPLAAAGSIAGKPGSLAALWARDRAALWARDRVTGTLDRAERAPGEPARRRLERSAMALSREAGILSTVASMVIVDAAGEAAAGDGLGIEVPVMLPAGYGGNRNIACESCACSYPMSAMAEEPILSRPMGKKAPIDLWDLLALQLPGGGFGPRAAVLRILGLATKAALLFDGIPATDLAAEEEERGYLAALAIAWLEEGFADKGDTWEALVARSRGLVERCASHAMAQAADKALPLEWARKVLAEHKKAKPRRKRADPSKSGYLTSARREARI